MCNEPREFSVALVLKNVFSKYLTVHVKGDGCAFSRGNSCVGGHTAVVPSSVRVDGVDRKVATRGHPLPVWKHLLVIRTQSGTDWGVKIPKVLFSR